MAANRPFVVSSSQPDQKLLERLAFVQDICLVLISLIAGVVFCAWLIPGLGGLLPLGWSLMKANTALCILLGAASVALSQSRRSGRRLLQSRVLAGLVVFLAGSGLFEHLSGRTTGLDTILASDRLAEHPGLMALQTSIYLTLFGLTQVFPRARKNALAPVVDVLTLGLVVMTLVILSGYCFGAVQLFGQSAFTRTSPQTLACMTLLAIVRVISRSEYGYFSVLVGIGIGSRIARTILPFAVVLPFVVVIEGAATILVNWLSAAYAAALTASTLSALFLILVLVMAWRINDLERDLRDMSLTDELTGIYNRRGFVLLGEQALREARRAATSLSILFFDLDGLKQVNDSLGHDVGSRMVRDMALLLKANLRGSDIVARVGGDEFAVVTHQEGLSALMERVEQAAAAAERHEDRPYKLRYSVGESSTDPLGTESFMDLVGRADSKMYERKKLKKKLAA